MLASEHPTYLSEGVSCVCVTERWGRGPGDTLTGRRTCYSVCRYRVPLGDAVVGFYPIDNFFGCGVRKQEDGIGSSAGGSAGCSLLVFSACAESCTRL